MINSSIIKQLVKNYRSIPKTTKKQALVVDKKLENVDLLEDLDTNGIDLILIGDNPGKAELKHQEYFSIHGNAGRYAQTFLEIAETFHFFGEEKLRSVLFNKTPFSTPKTGDLIVDEAVGKSIDYLIDSLNDLVEINPEVIILIVGSSKGKKGSLNRLFYPQLLAKSNTVLLRKIRIAKHFSHGNFYDQWLRHEIVGIRSIDGMTLHSNLTRMHLETCEDILKDFKLDFKFNQLVVDLNKLLSQAAKDLKNNRMSNPDQLDQIMDLSSDYSDMILMLDEEFERDQKEFLQFDITKLETINSLKSRQATLEKELSEVVASNEHEKAANLRDEKRRLGEEQFQEVLRLNDFVEGFNAYKGCLLIVKPKEHFKSSLIERFLEQKLPS